MKQAKKVLSLLLTVAMLCGLLVVPAAAESAGSLTVELVKSAGDSSGKYIIAVVLKGAESTTYQVTNFQIGFDFNTDDLRLSSIKSRPNVAGATSYLLMSGYTAVDTANTSGYMRLTATDNAGTLYEVTPGTSGLTLATLEFTSSTEKEKVSTTLTLQSQNKISKGVGESNIYNLTQVNCTFTTDGVLPSAKTITLSKDSATAFGTNTATATEGENTITISGLKSAATPASDIDPKNVNWEVRSSASRDDDTNLLYSTDSSKGKTANWSMNEARTTLTVDPKAGNADGSATTYYLYAVVGSATEYVAESVSDAKTFTVTRETAKAKTVVIDAPGFSSITIPKSGAADNAKTLTAKATDQFDAETTSGCMWAITPATDSTHVSIDESTGVVTVKNGATQNKTYTVTATKDGVTSAGVTFTVKDLDPQTFEGQSTFEAAATATYGDADFAVKTATLNATATADGGAITYSSSDTSVATIVDGNKIHILKTGTTEIIATAAEVADKWAETSIRYTLTVNPKTITPVFALDAASATYNGNAQMPEITTGSVKVADGGAALASTEYEVLYQRNNAATTDFTNAGTITVILRDRKTDNTTPGADTTGNYSFADVEVQYVIGKKTPAAEDFTFTAPTPNAYTGSKIEPTVTLNSPYTEAGDITKTYYLVTDGTVATGTTDPIAKGTYQTKITVAEGKNFNAVNTPFAADGTAWQFDITAAANTISEFTMADQTYDHSAELASYKPTPTTAPTATYGTVAYKYSKTSATANDFADNMPSKDVGTYWIKAYVEANDNYAAAERVVQFTINQAAAPELTSSTSTTPITLLGDGVQKSNKEYTVALATYISGIPEDAGTVTYTVANGTHGTSSDVDNTERTFKFTATPQAADTTDQVTVTVHSTNYADATVTIHFKYQNKTDVSSKITLTAGGKTITSASEAADKTITKEYTGNAAVTASAVYKKTADETPGTNVTVKFSGDSYGPSETAPKDAGTYTITAAYEDEDTTDNTAGHTGKVTGTLVITPKEVAVTWGSLPLPYNTTAQTPTVTTPVAGVTGESIELTVSGSGTDVGSDYSATASIASVTGGQAKAANYNLTNATTTFAITPKVLGSVTIEDIEARTYNGTAQTPAPVVKDGGVVIPATEYTVEYSSNTNAGTATVTVKEKDGGNYTLPASTNKTFTINPKTVTSPTITLAKTSYEYTGAAITPTVTVVKDGDTTIPASEYTVSYSNNTNKGTATVTITDVENGDYTVSGSTTFEITAPVLNNDKVTITKTEADSALVYTGSPVRPTWTVTIKNTTPEKTVPATDYDVEYTANTNAGGVTATFTFKNNYTGSATANFRILPVELDENDFEVDTRTGLSKTWDGGTSSLATANVKSSPSHVVAADKAGLKVTSSSAAYVDANVGSSKTITVTVNSVNNSNYTVKSGTTVTTGDGEITAATVQVNIGDIPAQTYTGSAIVPSVSVTAVVGGKTITLTQDTDYTVTATSNTNVGTATATITAAAGKTYTFATTTKGFSIVPKETAVTWAGSATQTYGATSAPTAKIRNAADTEDIVLTVRPDKTFGDAGEYTFTAAFGTNDSNYTLTGTTYTVTVAKAALTPNGIIGFTDKSYDGDTTVDGTPAVTFVEAGTATAVDGVTSTATFAYTSANASTGNSNSIKATGIALTGTYATNYTLTTTEYTKTGVDISKATYSGDLPGKELTIQAGTAAPVDYSIASLALPAGFVGATIKVATETTDTNNIISDVSVDSGKQKITITPKNTSANDNTATITLTIESTNYADKTVVLTVKAAATTVTDWGSIAAVAATYGMKNSEIVPIAGKTVTAKNGDDDVTGALSVQDADTVQPAGATTVTVVFTAEDGTVLTKDFPVTIEKKSVTPTVTAAEKVYDGTSAATVTITLDGVLSGDSVTATADSATFASADVSGEEAAQTVTVSGITLSGTDANNYQLSATSATPSAKITKKALTVSNAKASDRTYNGATTVDLTGSLVGVIGSDDVTLVGTGNGAMANANAGTGKAVTAAFTLSGDKAGNYKIDPQPTGLTVNISKAAIGTFTVSPATLNLIGSTAGTITATVKDSGGTDLDATLIAQLDDATIASSSSSGKTITFTGMKNGSATATFSLDAMTNYEWKNALPTATIKSIQEPIKSVSATASAGTAELSASVDGDTIYVTGYVTGTPTITVTPTYDTTLGSFAPENVTSVAVNTNSTKLNVTLSSTAVKSYTIDTTKVVTKADNVETEAEANVTAPATGKGLDELINDYKNDKGTTTTATVDPAVAYGTVGKAAETAANSDASVDDVVAVIEVDIKPTSYDSGKGRMDVKIEPSYTVYRAQANDDTKADTGVAPVKAKETISQFASKIQLRIQIPTGFTPTVARNVHNGVTEYLPVTAEWYNAKWTATWWQRSFSDVELIGDPNVVTVRYHLMDETIQSPTYIAESVGNVNVQGAETKASDGSYNYTFVGWASTENAESANVITGGGHALTTAEWDAIVAAAVAQGHPTSLDLYPAFSKTAISTPTPVVPPAAGNGDDYSGGGSGGGGTSGRAYTVTPTSTSTGSGAHGTISFSTRNAAAGQTVTITVKPDAGYAVDTVTVKDSAGRNIAVTKNANGTYSFTMPSSAVNVSATYVEATEGPTQFVDVPSNIWYTDAVAWAVEKGITNGMDVDRYGNQYFEPDTICTRAQMVTFLWRAAGSPEPAGTGATFADVEAGSWYDKAVQWAVENGVTNGKDGGFQPNAEVSRAEAVTFLRRALGGTGSMTSSFADVPADAWYTDSVSWALENGVTNGMDDGFQPMTPVNRAMAVTFLYRSYNK